MNLLESRGDSLLGSRRDGLLESREHDLLGSRRDGLSESRGDGLLGSRGDELSESREHDLLESRRKNLLGSRGDDGAGLTGPAVLATDDDRLTRELDAAASVFHTVRPRLFAIALRVLEDVGEAEDVVQEAWLRWERADRSVVVSPSAFLAMTATRLAINVTQSARRRHETSATPWLPETVDRSVSPETEAERREAVDGAVRLLMERLTPAERAVYVLRKAFDYPYRRISEILHLTADHTRQLVRRAHEHLGSGQRHPVSEAAHRHLVHTFLAAAQTGDLAPLEELLAADVAARSSGASGARPASSGRSRAA